MGLSFQKKKQVVVKISKILKVALSAVVASLDGIKVNELTSLRSLCRKNGVYVYVVRNTLLYRALNESVFQCLSPLFIGSNIIAFSTIDARDCARIFMRFSKENHKKFTIKGAVFDGVFIEPSKIDLLSSLPTYKDCIARLMFVIKESSIGRLIYLLHILCSDRKCKK